MEGESRTVRGGWSADDGGADLILRFRRRRRDEALSKDKAEAASSS
jgi:hypothetical protein